MKKNFFVLFFVFSLINLSNTAEALTRPSKLLLNTFSSQCPQVVTSDVAISLSTLQSLYAIVEELKNDKSCAGAVQLSDALSRFGSLYGDFQTQNTASLNELALEKTVALYAELISNPAFVFTPSQLSFLQSQMVSAQSSLVSAQAGLVRFQTFSGREARSANQVVLALNGFLSNLSQDQANTCYKNHGAQISSLISNALLVASAFAAPGASLALGAGGVIVSSINNYLENFKYNVPLRETNDIEMPIALRCVSQVLTDHYCSADATKSLINDRLNTPSKPQSRYEGITLLSYQLTSLSKWLKEVYTGSEITSQGDLVNREKPIMQYDFLRKVKRYTDTFGTMRRPTFDSIDNKTDRSIAIANAITDLAYIMENPSLTPKPKNKEGLDDEFENPIFVANSKVLMPFNLWSPGAVTTPPICGATTCTLEAYLTQNNIVLDVDNWTLALANASKVIQLSMDRVENDRLKTVSLDTYSIMVGAKRDLKGEVNPYMALQKINANVDRISSYLSSLGCKSAPGNCEGINNKYYPQISNIQQTKLLTSNVLQLIEESTIPRSTPLQALPTVCRDENTSYNFNSADPNASIENKCRQITSCISKILNLNERGIDVYFTKVRDMVSYEMEARLANNDLGSGLNDVILTTKNDLLQSILNSYSSADSSISLGELDTGLQTAQNTSKETLNTFFDFFKKDIDLALKSNKLSTLPKADFCFRLLPYLNESNQKLMKEVYESCHEAKMQTYKDGPKIAFTDFVEKIHGKFWKYKYVFKEHIDERARFCAYSDFHKSSLLYDEQIKQNQRQENTRSLKRKIVIPKSFRRLFM